ncbi:MAG TPA: flagellar basal body L-ring protein FlgH [Tepidisphaeraceae bacterium]|jgi:flagellar L-ring protein precursor FlgH
MKARSKVAGASVVLAAGVALGQTAPATSQPPGDRRESSRRQNVLTGPATNVRAEQSAAAMQQTNGSLLQAQLQTRVDPSQVQVKPAQVSFFAVPEPEPKTLKVHDLVQVIVREQSEITSKGTNNMTRDSELDAKVNDFVKLNLSHMTVKGLQPNIAPEINLSGTRSFQGQGEVDRSDSFTARITAEVVDVKPNGTVVLQARKRIKTDEEEQEFILTGTCRVEDIGADDSITSTQLYDLQLQKNHKGDVRQATKRGSLGKLLDVINPF